jgi:chromosome segregation ATPase
MWPKMLLELLPHFARLMPAADKYLNTRSASDKAQEAALAALAENVRGDLSQVTEEHAGLRRQLQEQTAQVAQVSVEITRARMGVESVEARITKVERAVAAAVNLLVVALVLLVSVSALLVVVLFKLKAH